MQGHLFGWFTAEIEGRQVDWIRRCDRQIFKYVALRPGGCVSRGELGRVFWPDTPRHIVARNLRTACSNIRKAIARIVGLSQVEAYFQTGDQISISLENVIVDVHRFVAMRTTLMHNTITATWSLRTRTTAAPRASTAATS